jgi:hypothetical protein
MGDCEMNRTSFDNFEAVTQAINQLQDYVTAAKTDNMDLHGRRISNAGAAVAPTDYVTLQDVLKLINTAKPPAASGSLLGLSNTWTGINTFVAKTIAAILSAKSIAIRALIGTYAGQDVWKISAPDSSTVQETFLGNPAAVVLREVSADIVGGAVYHNFKAALFATGSIGTIVQFIMDSTRTVYFKVMDFAGTALINATANTTTGSRTFTVYDSLSSPILDIQMPSGGTNTIAPKADIIPAVTGLNLGGVLNAFQTVRGVNMYMNLLTFPSPTISSTATAGVNGAPPAQVVGYVTFVIGSVSYKFPYYSI